MVASPEMPVSSCSVSRPSPSSSFESANGSKSCYAGKCLFVGRGWSWGGGVLTLVNLADHPFIVVLAPPVLLVLVVVLVEDDSDAELVVQLLVAVEHTWTRV